MLELTEEVVSASGRNGRRQNAKCGAPRAAKSKSAGGKKMLRLERTFSDPNVKPFDQVEWERRTAEITDDAGKIIFSQENVEVPKSWSLLATKVVVSKYFYGEQGKPERGNLRAPTHSPRLPHHRGLGDQGRLFFGRRTARCFATSFLAVSQPVWCVQFASVVQRWALSSVWRGQCLEPRELVFQSPDGPGGARANPV